MRRSILLAIVFTMLLGVIPAKAEESKGKYIEGIYVPYGTTLPIYSESDIKNTADKLFATLIEDESDTKDVYTLYQKGYYLESLILYRNYMIDRLRGIEDPDGIKNRGWYKFEGGWPLSVQPMDVLCGLMTPEEYNTDPINLPFFAKGYKQFGKDYGGYLETIDPDVDSHIRWLECPTWITDVVEYDGVSLTFSPVNMDKMIARYSCSGNDVYLKKYIQLLNDYSCNYVDTMNALIDGMSEEEGREYQKKDSRVWKYKLGGYNAAGRLEAAGTCERACSTLVLLAKSLPDPNEENQFSDQHYIQLVFRTFNNSLPEESYDLVDPVRFGNICYQLAYNEMFRLSAYLDGVSIGNQATTGLTGLLKYLCLFKDLKYCRDMEEEIITGLKNSFIRLNQPDGGYLELSGGYNAGDFTLKKNLSDWVYSICPEYAEQIDLSKSNLYFGRLREQYTTPTNMMTNYGNDYSIGTKAYWNDAEAAAELDKSISNLQNNAYTSVYLPYSGYGSMRENWTSDSLYLSFMNTDRPHEGHKSASNGTVNVLAAFKRPLILSGGTHDYVMDVNEVVDTSTKLKDKYYELNSFLVEESSKKWSTVIVNDKSQTTGMYKFNLDGTLPDEKNWDAQRSVDNKIINSRWLSNSHFDYAESKWDYGYTSRDGMKPLNELKYEDNTSIAKEAVHARQMIFVKDAGMWIVLDELENTLGNSKGNKYSQLWQFPGYDEAKPAALTGFKDEQVNVDNDNNLIYTSDTGNPNIFIKSFSQNDLSSKKYYGYYEPGKMGIGWVRGGGDIEMGGFAPRAVTYTEWNDKGYSDKTQLATALVPSKTEENPIKESKDLSDADKNLTAFELTMENGCTVNYCSSPDKAIMELGQLEIEAKSILVCETPDGKKNGIALDCTFLSNNQIVAEVPYDSFSFEISDEGYFENAEEILVPELFDWVEYPNGGYVPVYTSEQKSDAEEKAESISPFNDIDGHWACNTINNLYKKNIIDNSESFSFKPDESITRRDFTVMIAKSVGLSEVEYKRTFDDVHANDLGAGYIQAAYDSGLINGYGNSFDPNGLLTREQMAKILVLATKIDFNAKGDDFADSDSISEWARGYVTAGRAGGLFNGNESNCFMPNNNLTRAEAASCAENIMKAEG